MQREPYEVAPSPSRVVYEVERMVGIPMDLEIHIDGVRDG
jgi:hypothetical protein